MLRDIRERRYIFLIVATLREMRGCSTCAHGKLGIYPSIKQRSHSFEAPLKTGVPRGVSQARLYSATRLAAKQVRQGREVRGETAGVRGGGGEGGAVEAAGVEGRVAG